MHGPSYAFPRPHFAVLRTWLVFSTSRATCTFEIVWRKRQWNHGRRGKAVQTKNKRRFRFSVQRLVCGGVSTRYTPRMFLRFFENSWVHYVYSRKRKQMVSRGLVARVYIDNRYIINNVNPLSPQRLGTVRRRWLISSNRRQHRD